MLGLYPLSRQVANRAELRGLPEVSPLGLLQGPIPENYPLKPTSWGSEFEILAGLSPGEVAKPAQLAGSGPGSLPAT